MPGRLEHNTSVYVPVAEQTCWVVMFAQRVAPGRQAGARHCGPLVPISQTWVTQVPSKLSPAATQPAERSSRGRRWHSSRLFMSVLQRFWPTVHSAHWPIAHVAPAAQATWR